MTFIDLSKLSNPSLASFMPAALPACSATAPPVAPGEPWLDGCAQGCWQDFLQGVALPSAGATQELLAQAGFAVDCDSFKQAYHCATNLVRANQGLPAYEELGAALPAGVNPPCRADYYEIERQMRQLGLSQNPEAQVAVATLLGMGACPQDICSLLHQMAPTCQQQQQPMPGGSSQPAPASSGGGSPQPAPGSGGGGSPQPAPACGGSPPAPACGGSQPAPSTAGTTPQPLPEDLSGLESEEGTVQQELSAAQGDVSAAQSRLAASRTARLDKMCAELSACDQAKFVEAQQEYTQAQARVTELTNQQKVEQQAVVQTQNEITVETAKQTAAQADVTRCSADVTTLEGQLNSLTPPGDETCQADYESQRSNLEARLSQARARLAEAQARLDAATTRLATLQEQLATQQEAVETTTASLTQCQTQVQTALTKMDELRGGRSTADDLAADPEVTAAQAELEAAEARVQGLEQRLAAIRDAITQKRATQALTSSMVSRQDGDPDFDVPLPGVAFGEDGRDAAGQEAVISQALQANSGLYQTTYVPFTNSNGLTEDLCIYQGLEGEYYIMDSSNRVVHIKTGELSPESAVTALAVIADQYTAVPDHLRGGRLEMEMVPEPNDPTVGDYQIPGLTGDPVIHIYGVTDATLNDRVTERVVRHELGHWMGDTLDNISRLSIVATGLFGTDLGGSGLVQVPENFHFPAAGFVSPTTYGDGDPAEAFAEAWSAFDEAADDNALASYQAAFPEYYAFFTSAAFGYEHRNVTLAAAPQPAVVTNDPQTYEEFVSQWQAAYPGQPVPDLETATSAFARFASEH